MFFAVDFMTTNALSIIESELAKRKRLPSQYK